MLLALSIDVPRLGLTLDANVDFTPGDPAVTWLPPERCYEGSAPEMDILRLYCGQDDAMFLMESDFSELIYEMLLETATRAYEAQADEYQGPDE